MNQNDFIKNIEIQKNHLVDLVARMKDMSQSHVISSSLLDIFLQGLGSRRPESLVTELFGLFRSAPKACESVAAEELLSSHSGDDSFRVISLAKFVAYAAYEVIGEGGSYIFGDAPIRIAAFFLGYSDYLQADLQFLYARINFLYSLNSQVLLPAFERVLSVPYNAVKSFVDDVNEKRLGYADFLKNQEEILAGRSKAIDDYIAVLDKHKISTGIHAFAAAFEIFRERKVWERRVSLSFMIVIMAVLVGVPLYVWRFMPLLQNEEISKHFIGILPIAGVEFIFIYFLRILLIQFNSIQAQLLQLDIRVAATKFIQEFTVFKKELGGVDLDKFEALVFSGIVAQMENTPSTYDGLREVASLVSAVRGKKDGSG